MISAVHCITFFLLHFTYANGIAVGAPDTNDILLSPLSVVEHGDTIIVLDQEKERKIIKYHTIDGFFIKQRIYVTSSSVNGNFI